MVDEPTAAAAAAASCHFGISCCGGHLGGLVFSLYHPRTQALLPNYEVFFPPRVVEDNHFDTSLVAFTVALFSLLPCKFPWRQAQIILSYALS